MDTFGGFGELSAGGEVVGSVSGSMSFLFILVLKVVVFELLNSSIF